MKSIQSIHSKLAKAFRILWDSGAPIAAGTDIPNQALNPGISLWEELYSYIEAVISPREVLKAATSNAAKLLDTDIGIIGIGKRVNLVLLRSRPFEKPSVGIDKVIIGAKILDPSDLRAKLKKIPMFGY